MEWSGRRVAVVGLGVENTPLARFLARRGAQVTAFDRKPLEQLAPEARALADLGVRLAVGHDDLAALVEERFDAVFLTPGIVKDRPEIQAARQRGARITSQTNLFFSLCRAPIIGITGTSGKSTTTSLIGHILAADARRPVYVGGNLGQVLIEQVEAIPPDAWVVLELSSFQLELLEESPHIGVLLNLYPNHLDVHRTFEAYRAAKQRIYRFQRPERGDQAVFYYDDPALRTLSGEAPAGATFFGRSPDLPEGTTVTGDWAVIRRAARVTSVLPVSEIPLRGPHNVLNVLAAINVADLCQVPGERIREAVRSFRSLEHRLETVAEIDGVLFVNDSIATTPDRAAAALRSFDRPVVLIAGGYDKGIGFEPLAEAVLERPMRAIILMGHTASAIAAAVEEQASAVGKAPPPLVRVGSLAEAVDAAAAQAQPGDVVLLSPACASYDMFPSFTVRGQRFRELVQQRAQAAARPS